MTPPPPKTPRRRHRDAPVILIQLHRQNNFSDTSLWGGGDETLLRGVLDQAQLFGWQLLNVQLSRGEIPQGLTPQGAIVCKLPSDPLCQQLQTMGCPLVRIGRFPHPMDSSIPPVLQDISATAKLAAEHFHERGFQDVAFVARDPWGDMQSLYEAFSCRARTLGCTCHAIRIAQNQGRPEKRHEERAAIVAGQLAKLPQPVGVFCHGDILAGRVCLWCGAAGLSVPERVAVLGTGDTRFDCESAPVSLSSIDTNGEERGSRAACLLKQMLEGKAPPRTPTLIPPRGVVARRSTDILAVSNPLVAHAMRLIWDHFTEPLFVDDVATELGVARRTLERAFQKCLHRGIKEELQRKRLEYARQLLSGSELTIAEIAERSGIGTAVHLHRLFRENYGRTPRQFRLRRQGR